MGTTDGEALDVGGVGSGGDGDFVLSLQTHGHSWHCGRLVVGGGGDLYHHGGTHGTELLLAQTILSVGKRVSELEISVHKGG